jgi:adenylate cyclase
MSKITASPELRSIIERWIDAMTAKQSLAFNNLFSSSEHLRYVGSADGEVWAGSAFRRGYGEHTDEMPPLNSANIQIEAFSHGDSGWGLWIGTLSSENNQKSATFRASFVFALEDAAWRIVQMHISNPVSNLDTFGHEHAALDELLNAAKDLDPKIGRNGMASVMFTDIADSSAIAAAVGDTIWINTIHSHLELLTNVIAKNDGTLVKSLGDGTMSTFSSARAAMTAASEIQKQLASLEVEPKLQVRIGINTGDVVQSGDDFFGTVVNKAARIAGITGAGEIRISDATRIMVGGASEFQFSDPANVMLKGLEGDHQVYRIDW